MMRKPSSAKLRSAHANVLACLHHVGELSAWFAPDNCALTLRRMRRSALSSGVFYQCGNWRYLRVTTFDKIDAAVSYFIDMVGVTKAIAAARECARKNGFEIGSVTQQKGRVKQQELF